jgi:hypothetical protein
MRSTTGRAVVGTVVVAGLIGVLGGCTEEPAQDSAPPAASRPSVPRQVPPVTTGSDRAPLGFEVRYVDENGRFVTVGPEDFGR